MPTDCNDIVMQIPGPRGDAGSPGIDGEDGISAFTTVTAPFIIPAVAATVTIAVVSSAWAVTGEPIYVQNGGTFYVTNVPDATHITVSNPAAETGNLPPTTVVGIGNKVSPSGFKGAAGAAGGPGTGVTVSTKGDLQGYSAAPASVPVGTDGQELASDSTAATGVRWKSTHPNASGSTDNLLARFDTPAGTEKPAPLQVGSVAMTDNGALQHTGGNAKGTDAVDLSASRAIATQVASGAASFVAGQNNTASGANSMALGHGNTASGADSATLGGHGNLASFANSAVLSGADNTASDVGAVVAGGSNQVASGAQSGILSGQDNVASGQLSVISGGANNQATDQYSTVGGGTINFAVGSGATIPGGVQARADKYCQVSHASGAFFVEGDAQASEFIWRVLTTDAVSTEMFLDGVGASKRATVPADTTWAFHIITVARRDNGDSITFDSVGCVKNDAGTTSIVGSVTTVVVADGTGGAIVAGNLVVDADNGNDSLRLKSQGIAGQNWRWVSHARVVECAF